MDERRFSYPLELGIAMFNGDGALKPDVYQALSEEIDRLSKLQF